MDYRAQFTSQTIEENNLAREQKVEADKKRAAEIAKKIETLRQQQEAEMQRQHEAEMQRQQLEAEQQRQVLTQPTYSPISGRDPGTPVRAYTGLHNRFWRYTHPPQTRRAVSRTDFSWPRRNRQRREVVQRSIGRIAQNRLKKSLSLVTKSVTKLC